MDTETIQVYCRIKPVPTGTIAAAPSESPFEVLEKGTVVRYHSRGGASNATSTNGGSNSRSQSRNRVPYSNNNNNSSNTSSHSYYSGGDGSATNHNNNNNNNNSNGVAGARQSRDFRFDGVFDERCTQAEVYRRCAAPAVQESVLEGINATILCCGPRQSGKTYSAVGAAGSSQQAPESGIAARALHHIFEGVRALHDSREYHVYVRCLEMLGDSVADLLAEDEGGGGNSGGGDRPDGRAKATASGISSRASPSRPPSSAAPAAAKDRPLVSLDPKGALVLKHVTELPCLTEGEAQAALAAAVQRRRSPRGGHFIFSAHVRHRERVDDVGEVHHALLHVVDLAGRQPLALSPAEKAEAQAVNRSLFNLEQVVIALGSRGDAASGSSSSAAAAVSGGRGAVPYRQSKLTTYLKGCIGGRSRTVLLAHIINTPEAAEASVSALGFATRMSRVSAAPAVNTTLDPARHIRYLEKQIQNLQAELRLQAQLSNSTSGTGGGLVALGSDELEEMRDRVAAYVSGSTAALVVGSAREMHAAFAILRDLIDAREAESAGLRLEVAGLRAALAARRDSASPTAQLPAGTGRKGRRSSSKRSPPTPAAVESEAEPLEAPEASAFVPSRLERKGAGLAYGTASKSAKMTRRISAAQQHHNSELCYYYDTPNSQRHSLSLSGPQQQQQQQWQSQDEQRSASATISSEEARPLRPPESLLRRHLSPPSLTLQSPVEGNSEQPQGQQGQQPLQKGTPAVSAESERKKVAVVHSPPARAKATATPSPSPPPLSSAPADAAPRGAPSEGPDGKPPPPPAPPILSPSTLLACHSPLQRAAAALLGQHQQQRQQQRQPQAHTRTDPTAAITAYKSGGGNNNNHQLAVTSSSSEAAAAAVALSPTTAVAAAAAAASRVRGRLEETVASSKATAFEEYKAQPVAARQLLQLEEEQQEALSYDMIVHELQERLRGLYSQCTYGGCGGVSGGGGLLSSAAVYAGLASGSPIHRPDSAPLSANQSVRTDLGGSTRSSVHPGTLLLVRERARLEEQLRRMEAKRNRSIEGLQQSQRALLHNFENWYNTNKVAN